MTPELVLPLVARTKGREDVCSAMEACSLCGVSTPTTTSPRSFGCFSPVSVTDAMSCFQSEYDILNEKSQVLGIGACGAVWSAAKRETMEFVAVKIVARPSCPSTATNETPILKSVQNVNNVVRLIEEFSDEENEIIVMELCQGVDLQQWNLCDLSERDIRDIVYTILYCLKDIHQLGVCHMDVRLENIVAHRCDSSGRIKVKLIDFGSSVTGRDNAWIDLLYTGKLLIELVTKHRYYDADISTEHTFAINNGHIRNLVQLLLRANQWNYQEILIGALCNEWFSENGTH